MTQEEVANGATVEKAFTVSAFKTQLIVEAQKVSDAVSFYKSVFGAVETGHSLYPKRKADQELPHVLSAELKLAGSTFVVSAHSGSTAKAEGSNMAFILETDDVEAAVGKAVSAGALTVGEVSEAETEGGPKGKVTDPFGVTWLFTLPAKTTEENKESGSGSPSPLGPPSGSVSPSPGPSRSGSQSPSRSRSPSPSGSQSPSRSQISAPSGVLITPPAEVRAALRLPPPPGMVPSHEFPPLQWTSNDGSGRQIVRMSGDDDDCTFFQRVDELRRTGTVTPIGPITTYHPMLLPGLDYPIVEPEPEPHDLSDSDSEQEHGELTMLGGEIAPVEWISNDLSQRVIVKMSSDDDEYTFGQHLERLRRTGTLAPVAPMTHHPMLIPGVDYPIVDPKEEVSNATVEKAFTVSGFKTQLIVEAQKVSDAVTFYKSVFGAVETGHSLYPERKADQELPHVVSAELKLAGSTFVVSAHSGSTAKAEGSNMAFILETDDVEAAVAKAVAAGALTVGEVSEAETVGGAKGKVTDPFGVTWLFTFPEKKTDENKENKEV